MAREISRLNIRDVVRIKTPALHPDGAGLYLAVRSNGSKSWVFRFRADGKLHDMGLGPTHTVSLAEARAKALDCRRKRLDGINPIEERRAARAKLIRESFQSLSFKECSDKYIAQHEKSWSNKKHADQWRNTLAMHAFPIIGKLKVPAIDTAAVLKVLRPIWNSKPETANRVRGRIERVLDWATAQNFRQGDNPARWNGHLQQLLPSKKSLRQVKHHAALPFNDLPAFIQDLRASKGIAARGLELLILTAARTNEVISATWDEFDFTRRVWTLSAERMKGRREHRVPLTNRSIEILSELQRLGNERFVLPGGRPNRPLSNMAMLKLLQRMERQEITIHGFRSSFRDWASENTMFAPEVAEMALAHTIANKVEAAYRRGDLFEKRRDLMEAWSNYCEGNQIVVPIRKVAG